MKPTKHPEDDSPGMFDFEKLEDSEGQSRADEDDGDRPPGLGLVDSDTESESDEAYRARKAYVKRLHLLTRRVRSALAKRRLRQGRSRGDEHQFIEVSVEEKVRQYEAALADAVERDRVRHAHAETAPAPVTDCGPLIEPLDSVEIAMQFPNTPWSTTPTSPQVVAEELENGWVAEIASKPTFTSSVAATGFAEGGVSLVSEGTEAATPSRTETPTSSVAATGLAEGGVSLVSEGSWPWHEVQWRWTTLMTPAAIQAYAASATAAENITNEITDNFKVEDLCDDDDIINEAVWINRTDRPNDWSVDALGDEQSKIHISKRTVMAKKIGKRRYRLARGVTVDSGAADNVMPRRMLRKKAKLIRPSQASRAGVHYVAANNGRIRNEGEAEFDFVTKEGNELSWTFQIAEVNKVLAAVSALVDANCRVVFDRDDKTHVDVSYILDKKTNTYTKLRRERNVWVVDAWVEEEDDDDVNNVDRPAQPDAVFARQG